MSTVATIVAAPSPIEIGETKYQASPINLNGLGEIEEIVRTLMLANAADAAAKASTGKARDMLLGDAHERAMGVTFGDRYTVSYLRTFRGMVKMIAISLRPRHADTTEDQIAGILAKRSDQLSAAVSVVMRISDLTGEDGQEPGEAKAAEAA